MTRVDVTTLLEFKPTPPYACLSSGEYRLETQIECGALFPWSGHYVSDLSRCKVLYVTWNRGIFGCILSMH